MNSEILCPVHGVKLNKKPMLYGLPDLTRNHDGVILGGCLMPEDPPEYGYKCPVDDAVYYLGQDGMIKDARQMNLYGFKRNDDGQNQSQKDNRGGE